MPDGRRRFLHEPAALVDDDRPTRRDHRAVQCRRRRPRDPRPAAAPTPHRHGTRPRGDRGREGCRRLSSLQCRGSGRGKYGLPAVHAYGVVTLLEHEGIRIEGQNVVVVGASNIVGKPMALMLMQRDATVAICHAKTRDLAQFTILADILVVAAGHAILIVPQLVKTGAVVIDVGINRLPDGRITGDVDFEGVRQKASYITPVPGGVGPMTVTMLLGNTIASAERALRRAA